MTAKELLNHMTPETLAVMLVDLELAEDMRGHPTSESLKVWSLILEVGDANCGDEFAMMVLDERIRQGLMVA